MWCLAWGAQGAQIAYPTPTRITRVFIEGEDKGVSYRIAWTPISMALASVSARSQRKSILRVLAGVDDCWKRADEV